MSLIGASILAAKHSNLAQVIISKSNSLYNPTGYSAITPTFQDDSLRITPANGVTTPQWRNKVTYNLPKVSTLIGKCWVEIVIAAGSDSTTQAAGAGLGFNNAAPIVYGAVAPPGVDAAGNQPVVAYVKNVGDLIVDQHQMVYGNVQLQSHEGRFLALNRRLCCNDVNIEATNAMVLGGLPPGKFYLCKSHMSTTNFFSQVEPSSVELSARSLMRFTAVLLCRCRWRSSFLCRPATATGCQRRTPLRDSSFTTSPILGSSS